MSTQLPPRTEGVVHATAPEDMIQNHLVDQLFDDIEVAESHVNYDDRIEAWSYVLGDHIRWGNTKIADHVAIFNMGTAKDCPNRWTSNCQVDGDECYAVNSERMYPNTESFRQRQEYIWDALDAETWAQAFLAHVDRKRSVDRDEVIVRFSQSGDFRHDGDLIKLERIAQLLQPEIENIYTYSASNYLDWDQVESFTVNASNSLSEYGDRMYTAIPPGMDPTETDRVGDDAVQCPYDATDGEILCGDCRLCINQDGPDVYIELH